MAGYGYFWHFRRLQVQQKNALPRFPSEMPKSQNNGPLAQRGRRLWATIAFQVGYITLYIYTVYIYIYTVYIYIISHYLTLFYIACHYLAL
jgi:hypothetical protein